MERLRAFERKRDLSWRTSSGGSLNRSEVGDQASIAQSIARASVDGSVFARALEEDRSLSVAEWILLLRRRHRSMEALLHWRMKKPSRSWLDRRLLRSWSTLLRLRSRYVVSERFERWAILSPPSILMQNTLVEEGSRDFEQALLSLGREQVLFLSTAVEGVLELLLRDLRSSRSETLGDPAAIAEDRREIAEDGGEIHDEGKSQGDD